MKRLLFINGHLNVGGCERSLVDVLKHFDYKKYQVDLLLLEDTGDYLNEIPKEVNILLYSLNESFGPLVKCITDSIKTKDWFSLKFRAVYLLSTRFGKKRLKFARKQFPGLRDYYDTVIAFRPGICTDFAAYVVSAKTKISWWHHGEMMYSKVQAEAVNQSYEKMDYVVAVSESSARLVKNNFPNAAGKIRVIPNMICTEDLLIKSELPSSVEYSAPDELKLISIGRFAPEKNMVICPEIGRILLNQGIKFKWVMIGDGSEKDLILNAIKEYGLNDHFILTGALANPYPEIKQSDILVHPSLVESQGLTVLEAMAFGKPVVVVKSEGPKEFITDGVNGLLVNNDADDIAKAIIGLIHDQAGKNHIAAEASKVINSFSTERIIAKIESIV